MDTALKILIIPGIIPYPPDDGGKIYLYGFIDNLRKKHQISIAFKCRTANDLSKIRSLIKEWPDVRIYYTPFTDGDNKTSVISGFKAVLKRLYFFIKDKFANALYRKGLSMSITTPFYPQQEAYVNLIISILKENKFDIIQAEKIENINLIHIFPDDSKKIFVQIENRGEVIRDYGMVNQISKNYLDYTVKNTDFLEDQYMKLYDAIFTLNDSDRMKLQKRLPNVNVYNSPYAIFDRDIKSIDYQSIKLENIIFVGGESHYPNLDGLEWFLQDSKQNLTLSKIKNIYVTGKWKKSTQRRLGALDKRVRFLGFVDDLSHFFKNSVSIVPIRIGGGGIRTKILLSMAQNSPVISTAIAAVGVTGTHKDHFWIADTTDEFIEAIEYLFEHPQFTMKMIESANNLIRNYYSQSRVSALRHDLYLTICSH